MNAATKRRMIRGCVRACCCDVIDDIADITLSRVRLLLRLLLLCGRDHYHVLIWELRILTRQRRASDEVVAAAAVRINGSTHLIWLAISGWRRVFPIVDTALWTARQLSYIVRGVIRAIHVRQFIADAHSIAVGARQKLALGKEASLRATVGIRRKTGLLLLVHHHLILLRLMHREVVVIHAGLLLLLLIRNVDEVGAAHLGWRAGV